MIPNSTSIAIDTIECTSINIHCSNCARTICKITEHVTIESISTIINIQSSITYSAIVIYECRDKRFLPIIESSHSPITTFKVYYTTIVINKCRQTINSFSCFNFHITFTFNCQSTTIFNLENSCIYSYIRNLSYKAIIIQVDSYIFVINSIKHCVSCSFKCDCSF